jgi:hypothetical protein
MVQYLDSVRAVLNRLGLPFETSWRAKRCCGVADFMKVVPAPNPDAKTNAVSVSV